MEMMSLGGGGGGGVGGAMFTSRILPLPHQHFVWHCWVYL